MKGTDVHVSENLHETRIHGTNEFPIQYYEDMLHTFWSKSVPLHWHEELEFVTVLKGQAILQVMDKQILLSKGQSAFINSNVLHGLYMSAEESECLLPNIVFTPELIAPATSTIYYKYVRPLVYNKNIPYIIIDRDTIWSQPISELLNKIYAMFRMLDRASALESFYLLDSLALDMETFDTQVKCPEMTILVNINKIWQLLYANCHVNSEVNAVNSNPVAETRIQKMLLFIREHYKEAVTLSQIAEAADIGKSEAARCFRKYLQTSPIECLINYRIEQAAHLLINPHYSIREVGELCGFNENGYFSKTFRKKTGLSPLEFRRQNQPE